MTACTLPSNIPRKDPALCVFHSLTEKDKPAVTKFGVIEQIFQHSFTSKKFMWVSVLLYEGEKFDSQCGLWWAQEAMQQRIIILLSRVSHPLTTTVDNSVT